MQIRHPYLLFLGDASDLLAAKTALGVAQWRPDWCLGQLRLEGCQADCGVPDLAIDAAAAAGARTLIVGVANRGGRVAPGWLPSLLAALEAGLDIASGLHNRLADIPELAEMAGRTGCSLFDVRHPDRDFEVGNARSRSGHRLLTVGTDVSVGKMYTSLALEQALRSRGIAADFRATGQTGILIAGSGVSVDAVISDFVSGAAEWLSPANDAGHWDLVEGQGSLFHPSFAGVSLGLLHGAQADALVMCHDPARTHVRGVPHLPLPGIAECIRLNETCARRTNPAARVIGISCNTSSMSAEAAVGYLAGLSDAHGLPAVDPVRGGVDALVDALLTLAA